MARRNFYKTTLSALCLLGINAGAWAQSAMPVTVSVQPAEPLIEQGKGQQLLSLDFKIDNGSADKIELSGIEVSVLGSADKLVAQYRVGANGMSVLVVPNRFVEPGKSALVFNPLYSFPAGMDLSKLRFDFQFDVGDDTKYKVATTVTPKLFTPKVKLSLPIAGPALVHDGHDFYGHHRRLPLDGGMAQALQWKTNFMRYSYDFVMTDAQGKMYQGDGMKNEDWYGWGAPVTAPGAGTVIRAVANLPDNGKGKRPPFSREQFVADPSLMWGNHVEIDHGNGEISMLAHLKNGSVALKVGDVVKSGQKIGEMGFSGDAFLVHLHYDLKSGPGFKADGLPSPFNDFERLNGAQWQQVKHGQVDSGDIVRRAAK
jgi:murein DD-endopeptidase MepM/ murein hydrolase activator NlpD